MARNIWFWAHTATFLAHSAYMAASAVAFVVSSHKSMGNFEEHNDQCNSSCVIKAWGSSALVSRHLTLHHVELSPKEVGQNSNTWAGHVCGS